LSGTKQFKGGRNCHSLQQTAVRLPASSRSRQPVNGCVLPKRWLQCTRKQRRIVRLKHKQSKPPQGKKRKTMETFLKEHWMIISLVLAGLLWLSFCIECYYYQRDGIDSPGTDTIDMGD
jgi:hypothetical protein